MRQGLGDYLGLIRRYHRTLDLMSARGLVGLEPHLLDSLAYADLIADTVPHDLRLLDLGSGVGLPGIPLALSFPDRPIWLVERRQRRAAFLRIAASQLGLANVTVVAEDVRDLSTAAISCVSAQAVGRLIGVYCLTRHLHADTVLLVSRKSERWPDELAELRGALPPDASRAEARTRPLATHGTLLGVTLRGGLPCPSSV
ncbi:MAG: RsmG family class I SAM-dependent methyltransferase [Trueperaceae bacterium]|nr:RsmG family class I SAM-dependent methyltransferase [Trueperaceae bacterium]